MSIIRALFDIFTAVLRSVGSSLLLLTSTLITVIVVIGLVGFFGFGVTGIFGLRLSRRRANRRD